ncbi:MAG: CBS domain-containing protein [Gammaproteobacteria bacterium]|jgi:predicted transcriptional regulator
MDKKLIRVRDIMRTQFEYIDGTDTIRTALEKMETSDARILIVNKRHADDEHGALLLDHIAKQVLAKDKSPDRVNVYEIMSKPVIQVSPDMDIRYCARLFERYGLIRTPVVEQDKIVGIVSYNVLVLRGLVQLL